MRPLISKSSFSIKKQNRKYRSGSGHFRYENLSLMRQLLKNQNETGYNRIYVDIIVAATTLISAGLICWYTSITNNQLKELKVANALVRKNIKIQIAPYVLMDHIENHGSRPGLVIKNSGQTPAFSLQIVARAVNTDKSTLEKFMSRSFDNSLSTVKEWSHDTLGASGTKSHVPDIFELIPSGQEFYFKSLGKNDEDSYSNFKSKIVQNKSIMLIFGYMTYTDMFEDRFLSRFCFYYSNGDFGLKSSCASNNDILQNFSLEQP